MPLTNVNRKSSKMSSVAGICRQTEHKWMELENLEQTTDVKRINTNWFEFPCWFRPLRHLTDRTNVQTTNITHQTKFDSPNQKTFANFFLPFLRLSAYPSYLHLLSIIITISTINRQQTFIFRWKIRLTSITLRTTCRKSRIIHQMMDAIRHSYFKNHSRSF